MSKFRFSIRHDDNKVARIQKEIEDNFATKSDVSNVETKKKTYTKIEPKVSDLENGDKLYYHDGTNLYEYRKINGKLYKIQYTEV